VSERPELKRPDMLFEASELGLDEDGKLQEIKRTVGTNSIGMVAWKCHMRTPEAPDGRDVVIIASDVTVKSGSFGVEEDDFFQAASRYAAENGMPRIYIACNSGARIGLVDELKPMIQVEWNNPENPGLGFKFLYLTDEVYTGLAPGTVNATKVLEESGEVKWVLDDIIGTEHGIGVENLRGSGMIAGETSRAYTETFTLSYVTGRSVGIGAYLCRLGQRTIQMKTGPMILTGYSALNKLLGRPVYTSQDQLGGPQIMIPNGVSHSLVEDDQEGVDAILQWLSYVPARIGGLPSTTVNIDPIDRDVTFTPSKSMSTHV
jgi:acetyl-CoA carboxylase/biotin carboxylase 1